jgi:hypothetical protein
MTFPTTDATIARTDAAQTFTGVQTFSSDMVVNSLNIGRGKGAVATNTAVGKDAISATATGADNTALGYNTLKAITSGSGNTTVGSQAALAMTTGTNNTVFGNSALSTVTSSQSNTAIGNDALKILGDSTNDRNTAVGTGSFANLTSGQYNVGVGMGSLLNAGSGSNNVAVGKYAGFRDTNNAGVSSSNQSIFIGSETKPLNATSTNEIVIGYDARGLGNNSTVLGNSLITQAKIFGALDLPDATTSTSTTSGALKVGGGVGIVENLNVGGNAKITGTLTVTSGAGAGKVLTSDANGLGTWTTPTGVTTMAAIGSTPNANGATISGRTLNLEPADSTNGGIVTTGTQTFAGAKTFSPTLTAAADGETLVGLDINPTFTNGSYLALTNYALRVQGIGFGRGGGAIVSNTAIGTGTLINNTIGTSNTGLGYQSLVFNTSGTDNTAFGANAGDKISSGSKNIFVGSLAGSKIASASLANSTGTNSVLIGYDVRPAADSQTNQIVISGYNGTAGTVGLGSNTTLIGSSTTTSARIMGALDLPNATSSTTTTTGALKVAGGAGIVENLNVGGNTKITGTISIAGGTPGAGKVLTSTDSSGIASWTTLSAVPYTGATGAVDLGAYDLKVNGLTVGLGAGSITTNTTFGKNALEANTTGATNSAFGDSALKNNLTGENNTAVGANALDQAKGSGNTAVGSNSQSPSTGTFTGSNNTSLGYNSLNAITTGSYNIAVGQSAMYALTSGSYNTVIGDQAGATIASNSSTKTAGNNGIYIGYRASPLADSTSNEIVIGATPGASGYNTGLGTNSTVIGNSSTQQTKIYGALTVAPSTAATATDGLNTTIAAQNAGVGSVNNGGNIILQPGSQNGGGTTGIVQVNGQLKITGGTPAAGEVLVSDANGLATWSTAVGTTVVTSSTTYAITTTEAFVFYNGTAAAAFTLPAATATNQGKAITIKNKTAFGITITPATGTIYIDNANASAASVSIGIEASNNWIKLVSDGTQWNVLRALF